ncbi:hypothetical protein QQS21_012676 [Conoideocrella luteorostrata]|uniref:Enterotoxin n=1 Tax=Conoideocrella luteorostrata TaxID=1105319 RepID=A0AAJ0FMG3_9HYPO|nr:hypothetical protein QQS21_012676 [Conoideocrella luteorostrata]
MKQHRLFMLLWTTLLLLLVPVTGLPDATWERRGNSPSKGGEQVAQLDEDQPRIVWRGDTRSPEEIKRSGGFSARKNPVFTPEAEERAASLYWHSQGATPDTTKYVSASTDPEVAYEFSSDLYSEQKTFGYVFRISADEKFVNVPKSLGRHIRSGYAAQLEHASVDDIPWEQIEGWYPAEKLNKKEIAKLKKDEKLDNIFRPNPDFDEKKYGPLRGSGAQPQLGGIPKNKLDPDEPPWSEFKDKKVSEHYKEFRNSVCKNGCSRVGRAGTMAEGAEEGGVFVSADYLGVGDLSGALQAGEAPEGLASYAIMEAGTAEATAELAAAESAELAEAAAAMEAGEVTAISAEGPLIIEEILSLIL